MLRLLVAIVAALEILPDKVRKDQASTCSSKFLKAIGPHLKKKNPLSLSPEDVGPYYAVRNNLEDALLSAYSAVEKMTVEELTALKTAIEIDFDLAKPFKALLQDIKSIIKNRDA